MLPTVRWKSKRGKWIPCICDEGVWRTEGIVPHLFNVVPVVHWAEGSLCSGLTRGMLLAGGTSNSLSFAMNLFNRDFLLAGGLEWLALHTVHLNLGARASGVIKQEAGCSLLMVWTFWITHTFAPSLNQTTV